MLNLTPMVDVLGLEGIRRSVVIRCCEFERVCVTDDWLLEDVAIYSCSLPDSSLPVRSLIAPLHSPVDSHLLFSSGETGLLR